MKSLKHLVIGCCLIAVLGGLAFAQEGAAPQRSDIDEQYKWDLTDLYPNLDAWEAECSHIDTLLEEIGTFQGRLGESPEILLACLQLRDSISIVNDMIYVYARLIYDQDQQVAVSQERFGQAQAIDSRFTEAAAFIQPEVLSIGGAKLIAMADANDQLAVYRFYLEDLIRQQEHVLSEREEEILALASPLVQSPTDIFNMINNADLSFGTVIDGEGNEIELTRQRYYQLRESPDRDLRRRANEVYVGAFARHQNALAAAQAATMKANLFVSRVRGYNSGLEQRLHGDNIPVEVFDNLIKATRENLAPLHKWTALRKRILAVDTFQYYDQNAPLIDYEPPTYTWDEAKRIVLEALKPLGEEYLSRVREILDSRWIDVYESEGKRGGAYNMGIYRPHPYVLLNFVGREANLRTLAHELGHTMHSVYTDANEPPIYSGHSTFTAEVASKTNEALLMHYLIENATDPDEKLSLLISLISNINGGYFTQVFFSEYELAMHKQAEEGGAFSAEFMRQTYRSIHNEYWSEEMHLDSLSDIGCLRIPHFYRHYYVFQYATGVAASQMMAKRIIDGEPGAVESLMAFLKVGRSKYAIDILKDAGIDMTSPEPVNRALAMFSDLVDEVERLLDER